MKTVPFVVETLLKTLMQATVPPSSYVIYLLLQASYYTPRAAVNIHEHDILSNHGQYQDLHNSQEHAATILIRQDRMMILLQAQGANHRHRWRCLPGCGRADSQPLPSQHACYQGS